jgi:hypothetical protein
MERRWDGASLRPEMDDGNQPRRHGADRFRPRWPFSLKMEVGELSDHSASSKNASYVFYDDITERHPSQ